MKPRLLLIFPMAVLGTLAIPTGCGSDPRPAPSIADFTPKSGPEASTVTITGINFSNVYAENEVRFNGVKSTVSASTTKSITTTVPIGATSGVITVTIAGQSGVSAAPFSLNPLIGAWRFTGSTATNCPDPSQEGAATCTIGCPVLTFSHNAIHYADTDGTTYDFTYTLLGHKLTITSPPPNSASFSPSYILAGGQLTLVYPPDGCSVTETYVKQ